MYELDGPVEGDTSFLGTHGYYESYYVRQVEPLSEVGSNSAERTDGSLFPTVGCVRIQASRSGGAANQALTSFIVAMPTLAPGDRVEIGFRRDSALSRATAVCARMVSLPTHSATSSNWSHWSIGQPSEAVK